MRKHGLVIVVLSAMLLSNCGVESQPVPPASARVGVNVSADGVNTRASIAFSPLANLRIRIGI